jgi:hypothetical protein
MRYIPKKRLEFKYETPEGKMALIFDGNEDMTSRRENNWKISTATALPGAALAYYTF